MACYLGKLCPMRGAGPLEDLPGLPHRVLQTWLKSLEIVTFAYSSGWKNKMGIKKPYNTIVYTTSYSNFF